MHSSQLLVTVLPSSEYYSPGPVLTATLFAVELNLDRFRQSITTRTDLDNQ